MNVSFSTHVGKAIILNRVKCRLSVFNGISKINLILCAVPTVVTLIHNKVNFIKSGTGNEFVIFKQRNTLQNVV